MNHEQILNIVSLGVVVIDREFVVRYWNRWMAMHSNVPAERIVGTCLFDFFPNLKNPVFLRNCRTVFAFGNLIFFSQKLHRYLFPFKLIRSGVYNMEYMQQSCTIGPLRDPDNQIHQLFITIQDVTEIVAYEQKLRELNMTDGLTGIYNRRYLDYRIGDEFKRHKRFNRPMSVILVDIDHFKHVNDTYGHQFGDRVLQTVAADIASAIRNVDIPARYGGEEFCCILPETGLTEAAAIAERLRKKVMDSRHEWKDEAVTVSISLGVSCIKEGIDSPEKLVEKADKALYHAKENGRNRVVTDRDI